MVGERPSRGGPVCLSGLGRADPHFLSVLSGIPWRAGSGVAGWPQFRAPALSEDLAEVAHQRTARPDAAPTGTLRFTYGM